MAEGIARRPHTANTGSSNPLKTADIRSAFLNFFKERQHSIVASDSLIPSTDPTLLFTSAGMVQFKPNFQNPDTSPYKRAATCQKCLRTSDIERVGQTLRHLTFFEMLGNFSFGDYFKNDSIQWGWEFLTQTMKLPKDRLIVSVYKEDDDAFHIWKKIVPESRIVRLGEDSNFWTMGPTGPCGPCSEILFDRGDAWGHAGDYDGDRYLEIWNHVFTQFDKQADGVLVALPRKNIDTGMGLERLSLLCQGVDSAFDTEGFQTLFDVLAEAAKRTKPRPMAAGAVPSAELVSFRRVADHARAVTFMMADGILPSNEGRGYVLRRLLRQAVRAGKTLGLQEPFLFSLTGTVVDLMKGAYPELVQRRDIVAAMVKGEEEKFLETLGTGTRRLEELVTTAKVQKAQTLSGRDVFQLYDTFGFPYELTKEMAEGMGFGVEEKAFKEAQQAAVALARQGWKGSGVQEVEHYRSWKASAGVSTVFKGYETKDMDSVLVKPFYKKTEKGWVETDTLLAGDEAEVVCQETPFFAERGGQIGDTGWFETGEGKAEILDTQCPVPDFNVHRLKVTSGTLKAGAKVRQKVDAPRREAIMRHHTATHLLHQTLRDLFGKQLTQAGSLVAPDRLRFDFTHNAPLTKEERQKVEDLINEHIMNDIPVRACTMTKDHAMKVGALMLFGEKYGEHVRAVMISPHDCSRAQEAWSLELCGGTHVPTTGHCGFFKILGQSSVSSGVRRLEAAAGPAAMKAIRQTEQLLSRSAEVLKTTPEELPVRLEKFLAQRKQEEKDFKAALANALRSKGSGSSPEAKAVDGISYVADHLEGVDIDFLRERSDHLRDQSNVGVVVLATTQEDKISFVVSVQKALVARGLHAGKIAKDLAARLDGSGGGRAEFAQGGGKNLGALDKTLAGVEPLIKAALPAAS